MDLGTRDVEPGRPRGLDRPHRPFLACMAPRGVVAASTAALYSLRLEDIGQPSSVLAPAAFAVVVRRGGPVRWLLPVLAFAAWALAHESGVHATVAGVLLGFTVPVLRRSPGAGPGLAEQLEHQSNKHGLANVAELVVSLKVQFDIARVEFSKLLQPN